MTSPNDGSAPPRTFETSYDDAVPASTAVVRTICAIENVDPVNAPEELDFTLFDRLDPEALDAIVGNGSGGGDVVVDVMLAGYRVLIADTGRIRVHPRA